MPYRIMGIIEVAIRRMAEKHEALAKTFLQEAEKAEEPNASVRTHRKKEESGVKKSVLK